MAFTLTQALSKLRDILVTLVGQRSDIDTLLKDAQVDDARISDDQKLYSYWTNVLEYAWKNEQVEDIIRIARNNFPKNSELIAAESRWQEEQATRLSAAQRSPSAAQAIARPLPAFSDLFELIYVPAEAPAAIFRVASCQGQTPYEIPYLPGGREGVTDIRKTLYEDLMEGGGRLLLWSRKGLGKTREVSELATRLCENDWILCVAKIAGDVLLQPPAELPPALADRYLLLVFDDLHRRAFATGDDATPYPQRLQALLTWLDERLPGYYRVLATARSEPHYQKSLGYVANQPPWNRFKHIELPEFSQDGLVQMLRHVASAAAVAVDDSLLTHLVKNSDGTIRNPGAQCTRSAPPATALIAGHLVADPG